MAFGVSLALMLLTIGQKTGGHFNPAVTAIKWAKGDIDSRTAVAYIVAQVLGAAVALVPLWIAVGSLTKAAATVMTQPGSGISLGQVFLLEMIGMFIFALVIDMGAEALGKGRPVAVNLLIAGTLALLLGLLADLTGGGVNPARAAVPMLFSGKMVPWEAYVAYVSGPLLGAVMAAVVSKMLAKAKQP